MYLEAVFFVVNSYVLQNDDPCIPPPYDFPGITIMSFRLPAKLANLQILCDQWLNVGSLSDRGFEYRAFLDFVDMEIVTYPQMKFAQPPYSNWGYASQQELYFRIYVWKFISIGGVLFPDPIPELFFPFMYVDNSWSMMSGRGVLGFPKVLAQFDPTPVLDAKPLKVSASALVMDTFAPTTKLDWKPVVQIAPTTGVAASTPNGKWPWIELGADVDDSLLGELLQAVLTAIPNVFRTVQLKQSRETVTGACYQAVINTSFRPTAIYSMTSLAPVTITVNKYASLDIPGSLGFPAGVPLQPSLQYSIQLDMSMSQASVLFVNR